MRFVVGGVLLRRDGSGQRSGHIVAAGPEFIWVSAHMGLRICMNIPRAQLVRRLLHDVPAGQALTPSGHVFGAKERRSCLLDS